MTGGQLTARERLLLAVGAALVIPAMAWRLAAEPYVTSVRTARATLDARRALLGRELRMVRDAAGAQALRDSARTRVAALATRVLNGDDAGEASAELTGIVRALADENRLLLTQVEGVAPTTGPGGLTTLALRIDGEGDVEGLLGMLAAIETDSLVLRVEHLEVSARRAGGAPVAPRLTAASAPADDPETLGFRAVVRAFALPGVPEPPASPDSTETTT